MFRRNIRPAPPIKEPDEARNPIDRFVIARLEEEGLRPSPEADKTTLIRRVTLDLTGLPPTIGEVDAFLADRSPNAYEKLVDRLLGVAAIRRADDPLLARRGPLRRHARPASRQRTVDLAVPRLVDPCRSIPTSRIDQFTVEQLAGDLLPHPTIDQRVATGFSRCNVTTGEGGAIDEEFYVRYAVDRVQTTGTVFLGLTLGCCVCHDHKFDPITQKEFYRLFGYFGSLTEQPMDRKRALAAPVRPRRSGRRGEGRSSGCKRTSPLPSRRFGPR